MVKQINQIEDENVRAYEYLSMCTEGGSSFIQEKIEEDRLDRIVVAA